MIALDRAKNSKAAALQGFWLGYFMSLGGFYWIAATIQEFGGLPWPLCIIALLLFATFNQPQFLIFAPFFKSFSSRRTQWHPILMASVFAFAYTGIDWILPKLFLDTLGHSFYLSKTLRQAADLGGASLLTFFIYFFNESLFTAWKDWKSTQKLRLHPHLASALILWLGLCVYGHFRYQEITQKVAQSQKGFQAAAIQANIGDIEKLASERGLRGAANRILDTFFELTTQAMNQEPKPDVIIWPETSYPTTFRNPHTMTEKLLDERLETFSRQLGVPLLFGGYDLFQSKEFNAFFFLSPQGDLQIYRKNILLLFGEFIPGSEYISLIREAFPQVGNFGRGPGPSVLPIPSADPKISQILAGPMICYEALFPNYIAEGARKGSQFILNITNDSWFGNNAEPYLHLALTTFRSIETRIPMLRSTNTGISTLITADGEITSPTQLGTQAILNVRVPVTDPIPTLIKLWGDWFGPASFILGLIGFWGLWWRTRRN
jgi:apolipoprotein N-acyltransferase